MTLDVIGFHSTATRRDSNVSLVKSISSFIKTHISTYILILNPFILAARLYLPLSFFYVDFLRLSFSTFIFRRDSEAPVEAGKSSQGVVFRWVRTFRLLFSHSYFFSSPSVPISPPMTILIQSCSESQRRSSSDFDTTASHRNQLWQFVRFNFRLYKRGGTWRMLLGWIDFNDS